MVGPPHSKRLELETCSAGCSEYLVDRQYRNIPDAVATRLIAAYALTLVTTGRDPSLYLQALQDDFAVEGRNLNCFKHPLVSAARRQRSRQKGRKSGRNALRQQREAINHDMLWWGINEFLVPPDINLRKSTAKQADYAMAMLAGLITYHWQV